MDNNTYKYIRLIEEEGKITMKVPRILEERMKMLCENNPTLWGQNYTFALLQQAKSELTAEGVDMPKSQYIKDKKEAYKNYICRLETYELCGEIIHNIKYTILDFKELENREDLAEIQVEDFAYIREQLSRMLDNFKYIRNGYRTCKNEEPIESTMHSASVKSTSTKITDQDEDE